MSSGRERAVLVWGARHALEMGRLARIERALADLVSAGEGPNRKRHERAAELADERRRVLLALERLGPSPQAKMG